MIRILRLSFAALVTGNVLLLCVAVLLFLILRRIQTRAREPETPSEQYITCTDNVRPVEMADDRQRGKIAQEDAEAWRRMQAYTVDDAYGGSSG